MARYHLTLPGISGTALASLTRKCSAQTTYFHLCGSGTTSKASSAAITPSAALCETLQIYYFPSKPFLQYNTERCFCQGEFSINIPVRNP